jgi:pyruvate/2-oxoglutarate dehydrogenase complex dihydrolipoamide acyltransferase (E2) component
MQQELRNAPGGSGLSSTFKGRGGLEGGPSGGSGPKGGPKGGRRGASSGAAAGAAAAAADAKADAQTIQAAATAAAGEAGGAVGKRPASRERPAAPSEMTAAERVAAELAREGGVVLVTCSACRVKQIEGAGVGAQFE